MHLQTKKRQNEYGHIDCFYFYKHDLIYITTQSRNMNEAKHLSQKISEMKTAKYGEDITLNKPLLVLYALSEYKKGHKRMFDYGTEVKPNLKKLLKTYGPKRRGYATDMPFWRLRHDEFWVLENVENCSSNGIREPSEIELISNNVAGGFNQSSFSLLEMNPHIIDELANEIIVKYIPQEYKKKLLIELGFKKNTNISDYSIQRNKITLIQIDIQKIEHDKLLSETTKLRLIEARVGQGDFRKQCMNLYPSCPVTGINFHPLLRASHIKPWADCKSVKERLDPFNGIMLAAHIDALFDDGWISFKNHGEIIISKKLDYQTYNILNLPTSVGPFNNESLDYLDWHRERIFRG